MNSCKQRVDLSCVGTRLRVRMNVRSRVIKCVFFFFLKEKKTGLNLRTDEREEVDVSRFLNPDREVESSSFLSLSPSSIPSSPAQQPSSSSSSALLPDLIDPSPNPSPSPHDTSRSSSSASLSFLFFYFSCRLQVP